LNYDNYHQKLINRYKALRGNYFSFNNLTARFSKYRNLFEKSGAITRELNKWPIGEYNNEMTFLNNWIRARLNYLDNKYLGGPFNSLPESNASESIVFGPNPVKDMLTISNLTGGENIQIISLQGRVIFNAKSDAGEMIVNMSNYTPGIYLLKMNDQVVKIVKQ
jgi:hypothetical protein